MIATAARPPPKICDVQCLLVHSPACGQNGVQVHWHVLQESVAACADAENDGGLTPLHSAALGSSLSCAQLLLDAGADRNATDRDGRTPSDHAPEAAEKLRLLLKPSAAAKKLPGATQANLNGVPAEEQSPSQAFAVSVPHT